ncbi:MAG TPA: hypothetical protein PKD24_13715 [Pyrinomonadaceae bacterium]|nr:hypothetical protein [Pyrinomonadaceae bacterium]HMP66547.1 hypothetical protein [Pyrinomonadaceae bacterium]
MFLRTVCIGLCLLWGTGAISLSAQSDAQQKPKQPTQDSEQKAMEIISKQGIFRSTSSTEAEADEGFRIVAVRRIYIMVNDAFRQQQRRKDMVEIELYAEVLPLATALGDYVQIGAKVFPPSEMPCRDNENCIRVAMAPKQFDELKNNSLVTMFKGLPKSPEVLEELYKDGEPKTVYGVKFGRLDKTMVDKFPTLDRSWSPL